MDEVVELVESDDDELAEEPSDKAEFFVLSGEDSVGVVSVGIWSPLTSFNANLFTKMERLAKEDVVFLMISIFNTLKTKNGWLLAYFEVHGKIQT